MLKKKNSNSNMSTCFCDIKLYKVINVIDFKKMHYCIIFLFDRLIGTSDMYNVLCLIYKLKNKNK